MKTILENLETLPEPYKSQAIFNFKDQWEEFKPEPVENIKDALCSSFFWKSTKEGYHYWRLLHDSL
jgi:hypothetical protein